MKTGEHYQSQTDTAFDLAELLAFLWLKKFRIVFFTILIVIAGAYHIFNLPKIYTASSTILLGDGEQGFSLSSTIANFGNDGDAKIDTYIEFIRSRQFIGQVVDELSLVYDLEFRPVSGDVTNEYVRDHAIDVLLEGLSLSRLGDTTLLKVMFSSEKPKTAAAVANTIGPAFFAFQSDMGKQKANATSQWLSQQLVELQTKLAVAEQTLQDFLIDNNLTDVSSKIEIARIEISGLLQERLAIEKMFAEVSASVGQVQLAAGKIEQLVQIPWVLNNQMMISVRRNISAQEQLFAELSKRYKSKHHRYISAVTTLSTLRNEQQSLVLELSAGLMQEFDKLKIRKRSVDNQVESAKKAHGELGKHELQLDRLRREVESTQTLYEVFLSRLRETEILKDLGSSEQFAVIDTASVPVGPSKPRVALLMALVLMFGSLASSGFWLVLHLVSDKKTRFKKLLQMQGLALLGELPKPAKVKNAKTKNSSFEIKIPTKAEAFYTDSVRVLRSELMVRSDELPIRTLVLTSVQHGKRRSKLAIELAESFAGLEKSIIVDADLRQPQIGIEYGLEQLTPGLTNFISRRSAFSESNFREKGSQLSVMPSGAIPNDPLVYLTKPRFGEFIKKLGVLFEQVIIEAPPVNAYSDTLVVSKLVDAVVLLCDVEVTESADLLEAIQRLQDSGAPLLGVVFENSKNIKSKLPQRSRGKSLIKKVINY
jgi:succinoglycan biosynthesis transport protein ExoP